MSFVCLSPTEGERPLTECTAQEFTSICQYEFEDDAGNVDAAVFDAGNGIGAAAKLSPHLYALVTQTETGEVAVVDTSALSGAVLDENPLEPGANFLHVGAQPTGIVSTPGSVATFVGTAEIGRPAIYVIPSSEIRPAASFGVPDTCIGGGGGDAGTVNVPQLSSWPTCSLLAAPGDILLINDPSDADGNQRRCCPSADGVPSTCGDSGYYPPDQTLDPISFTEGSPGRPKLIVSIPDYAGFVVIDAQELYNRPAGSHDPCKVERFVPLQYNPTGVADYPPEPTGLACRNAAHVNTQPVSPSGYPVRPGGLSYADGKLYVSDLSAPVIHVVDMHAPGAQGHEVVSPCNPVEQAPLLPTSAEDPHRVVFASKISAAPALTPDFKRYLYATDVQDASVMVFDISTSSTTRRPLQRAHKEWNPFQPRDRIKFPAPPADIVVVQHDQPAISPVTGVAPTGVLCDPNPGAVTCIPSDTYCDLGTSYRTSPDYTLGAGPLKLRGEFAFAALTNGRVAVIDIADFDAPCRTPATPTPLAGCSTQGTTAQVTSQEVSRNVVGLNEPRANVYEAVGSQPGNHVPGIQTFPLLYANDGSVYAETAASTPPIMVATLPASPAAVPGACTQPCDPLACGTTCDTLPGCPLQTFVGGIQTPIDLEGGQCTTPCQDGTACTGAVDCCKQSTCGTQGVCHPANCAGDRTACTPAPPSGQSFDPNCNPDLCEDCLPDGITACTPAVDAKCTAANCVNATWGKPTVNPVFTPGAIQGNNGLAMNLEDPRAQIADQNWAVTFEGPIPGFDARLAALELPSGSTPAELVDPNSRFCDNGVLGEKAFEEMLTAKGLPTTRAAGYADYVQITSDIPNPEDPYWTELSGFDGGTGLACNYAECLNVFGPIEAPDLTPTRDLRIVEAYEDHVELEVRNPGSGACGATPKCAGQCLYRAGGPNDGPGIPNTCVSTLDEIKCCFPSAVTFAVRTGQQWSVVGDQSGFLHHVVPDATSGVCRNACDPTFARRNGRLIESSPSLVPVPIPDHDANPLAPDAIDPSPAFLNPMFRFAIVTGQQKCAIDTDCTPSLPAGKVCDPTKTACCDTGRSRCVRTTAGLTSPVVAPTPRDAIFRFATNGSFQPMPHPSVDGRDVADRAAVHHLPGPHDGGRGVRRIHQRAHLREPAVAGGVALVLLSASRR